MSCKTCKELKSEKNMVRITEIEIEGMYYHWSREIKYCPTCGKYIPKQRLLSKPHKARIKGEKE